MRILTAVERVAIWHYADSSTDPMLADFMAWCIQNHRPPDTQSLGKYAQANDLTAQNYRDLEAFLQGAGWPD